MEGSVNAYVNGGGEAKASLTFHATQVKLLGTVATVISNGGEIEELLLAVGNLNGSAKENVK